MPRSFPSVRRRCSASTLLRSAGSLLAIQGSVWAQPVSLDGHNDESQAPPQIQQLSPKISTYFHDVPPQWRTEFHRVLGNLVELLGDWEVEIIAWPSNREPPIHFGRRLDKGQYVSGRRTETGQNRVLMVLEIDAYEQAHQHPHRLSVMAHEYFHVYQRHANPALNDKFAVKWLIEGSAAVFESLYLRDFERVPDYWERSQRPHVRASQLGGAMERYDNPDTNYGTSTAMLLYACRETGFQGLVDFWRRRPNNENWKAHFEAVFHQPVDQFYEQCRRIKPENLSLAPMGALNDIRFKKNEIPSLDERIQNH